MMELVAFLGTDKENWGQVSALINRGKWDKILIVKNKEVEDSPFDCETIKIDSNMPLIELKESLLTKLKDKIGGDFEVALSIAFRSEVEDSPFDCETIKIDSNMPLIELKESLLTKLKDKIGGDFEVALSIASGNGKEHMALISALLSIPVGIKFAAFTKKGIEYLT